MRKHTSLLAATLLAAVGLVAVGPVAPASAAPTTMPAMNSNLWQPVRGANGAALTDAAGDFSGYNSAPELDLVAAAGDSVMDWYADGTNTMFRLQISGTADASSGSKHGLQSGMWLISLGKMVNGAPSTLAWVGVNGGGGNNGTSKIFIFNPKTSTTTWSDTLVASAGSSSSSAWAAANSTKNYLAFQVPSATLASLGASSGVGFFAGTSSSNSFNSINKDYINALGSSTSPTYSSVQTVNTTANLSTVQAPTITSFTPTGGDTAGGTQVTITGTNLDNLNWVKFGTNYAQIVSSTSTSVTVFSPAGSAGSVQISVNNVAGTATSTGNFTYSASLLATTTVLTQPSGLTTGVLKTLTATIQNGSGLNLTATTGAVVFKDANGTTLCSASVVSAVASCSYVPMTVAAVTISATYGGDATYKGSTATAAATTPAQGATKVVFTAAAGTAGTAVALVAYVYNATGTILLDSATGSVTFKNNTTTTLYCTSSSSTLTAVASTSSAAGTGIFSGGAANCDWWAVAGNTPIIAAYGGDTNFAASSVVSNTGAQVLATPTSVAGTPAGTSISVAFGTVTNGTTYMVRVYDSTGTLLQSSATGTSSPINVTGLVAGTSYKVSVQAIGDGTNFTSSAESTQVSVSTLAALPVPNPTASAIADTTATISFAANSTASSVSISISPTIAAALPSLTTSSTSAALTGLAPGVTYTVTITAVGNGTTTSSSSGSVAFITNTTKLATPSVTIGSVTSTSIAISWVAIANASSYSVQLRDAGGNASGTSVSVAAGTTTYTATGLAPGTAYSFVVTAIGNVTNYTNSDPSTATTNQSTSTQQLSQPVVTLGAVTSTSIVINWGAIANASSYSVQLRDGSGTAIGSSVSVAAGTTTYTVSGLTPGVNYTFTVTAIGNVTNYTNSAASSLTTSQSTLSQQLATPTLTSTGTTTTTASFTVGTVSNSAHYRVLVYTSSGTALPAFTTDITSGTSVTVTGLSGATNYKFAVYAIGDGTQYTDSALYNLTGTVGTQKIQLARPTVTQTPGNAAHDYVITFPVVVNASSYTIVLTETSGSTQTATEIWDGAATTISHTFAGVNSNKVLSAQVTPNPVDTNTYVTDATNSVSSTTAALNTFTPIFGSVTSTADGYSVPFSNYSNAFDFTVTVNSGSVSIVHGTGSNYDIVVTGLNPGSSAAISLTWHKAGYADGSQTLSTYNALQSSAAQVTAYTLSDGTNSAAGTIDQTAHTISVTLPYGTSLNPLGATFSVSGYATLEFSTVTVSNNFSADYRASVTVTVRAQDGTTQDYTVLVTTAAQGATTLATPSWDTTVTGVTSSSVDLAWSAVANATGYTIDVYDSSNTLVATAAPAANVTTATISGLNKNTAYTFTITANGNGTTYLTSVASSTISRTTAKQAIGQPTVSTATSTTSPHDLLVTITPVTGASLYSVVVTEANGNVTSVDVRSTSTSAFTTTISGINPNRALTIQVIPVADDAVNSDTTNATASQTPALGTFTATYGTATRTTDGYTIEITNYSQAFDWVISVSAGTASLSHTGGAWIVTVTGLTPGASAALTVTWHKAGYADGTQTLSSYSALPAAAATLSAPTWITTVTTVTETTVDLSWSTVANTVTYSVKVYDASTTLIQTLSIAAGTTTTQVTGLTRNSSYTFTVTAVGNGTSYLTSVASTSLARTTAKKTIGQPTVAAAPGNSSAHDVVVTITPVDGASNYHIIITEANGSVTSLDVRAPSTATFTTTVAGINSNKALTIQVVPIPDDAVNSDATNAAAIQAPALNSFTPTFGTLTRTSNGYSVEITNYSPAFDWTITPSAGTATLNHSGGNWIVTVTGLSAGASATLSVTAARASYNDGTASVSSSANAATTPAPSTPAPTPTPTPLATPGVTATPGSGSHDLLVTVTPVVGASRYLITIFVGNNPNPVTRTVTAPNGLSPFDNLFTGINTNQSLSVSVQPIPDNPESNTSSTASDDGLKQLKAPLTPSFGAVTSTANGFTVEITNYSPAFDWSASSTTGSASIVRSGSQWLLVVTGLNANAAATATVGTARVGYSSGSGTASGASQTSTTVNLDPTKPVAVIPIPENAGLKTGQQKVEEGGKPVSVVVAPNSQKTAVDVTASDWTLAITPVNAPASSNGTGGSQAAALPPVDASGSLNVVLGSKVAVTGTNFAPNTIVKIFIFSTPHLLGEVLTDADGNFSGDVIVPASLETGTHTLQVNGLTKDNNLRTASVPVIAKVYVPKTAKMQIFFGGNSAEIGTGNAAKLNAFAKAMLGLGASLQIKASGYAKQDISSTTAAAVKLSQRRAKAVAAWLKSQGVTGTFSVRGLGYALQNSGFARRVDIVATWQALQ